MTSATFDAMSLMNPAALSSAVLQWLCLSLLYGTLLVGVAWLLLKTVFRRTGAAFAGAIWTIVLIKFVVPTGPDWSFSLATGIEALAGPIRWAAPGLAETAAQDDLNGTIEYIALIETEAADSTEPIRATVAPASDSIWPLGPTIAILYLVIVAAMMSIRLRQYRRVMRRCRALPPADEQTKAVVESICRRMGARRVPDLRLGEEAPAPFIVGMWRPMLILSGRHLADPDELEAIILHEIAHLRRGDILVRYLQCLVGTLLFFWPVVAWVNRRIDLAREHACDDWALFHGRLSAADYARCLLRAMHPVQSSWSLYRPAAMAANRKTVERRIEMILQQSERGRRARTLGIGALVVLLAWGGFALTGAAAVAPPTDDGDQVAADAGTKRATVLIELKDGLTMERIVEVDENENGEHLQLHIHIDASDAAIDSEDSVVASFSDSHERRAKLHEHLSKLHEAYEGKLHAMVETLHDFHFNVDTGDAPAVHRRIKVMARHLIHKQMDPASLEKFRQKHPTADADTDGQVTNDERDAFLVALAMRDPVAVLDHFPKIDANEDGLLQTSEAVRLVRLGDVAHGNPHADEEVAEAQHGTILFRPDDQAADSEDDESQVRHSKLVEHFGMIMHEHLTHAWLLNNIDAIPSTDEVLEYLPAVENAAGFRTLQLEEIHEGDHASIEENFEGKLRVFQRIELKPDPIRVELRLDGDTLGEAATVELQALEGEKIELLIETKPSELQESDSVDPD